MPNRQKERKVKTIQYDTGLSTRRDGKIGRHVRVRLAKAITVAVAVRTTGAAGLGASAQRLFDDGLDGTSAPPAFGAAAEAAIELLGVAWKILRGVNGAADIVVGKDVAGTNNHGTLKPVSDAYVLRIGKTGAGCKRKNRFFK